MEKYLLLVLSFWLGFSGQAQVNLIPNGSFEEFTTCPDNTEQVDSVIGWHDLLNTPDFFHTCATIWWVAVPDNLFGSQMPFEGNGYVGVCPFDFSLNYREIVGTDLLDTLVPGNTYQVSMRVSRANGATFTAASNNLGMRFTTSPYTANNPPPIDNFAHLYSDTLITDSTNWVLLHWNFIPDSPYMHMYIGNFFDDEHTDTMALGSTAWRVYYYIDSVAVVCDTKDCLTGIDEQSTDQINILYDPADSEIEIKLPYNVSGLITIINSSGLAVGTCKVNSSQTISTSAFPSGIYFIKVQSNALYYYQKNIHLLTSKTFFMKSKFFTSIVTAFLFSIELTFSQDWQLIGNAVGTTDFLGTTNGQD